MACHGPWLYHGPSKDHWAPHSEAWPKFPSLFRKSSTLCGMWHGSDLFRIHPNRRFRIVFDFNLFQKVAFGGIFWKKTEVLIQWWVFATKQLVGESCLPAGICLWVAATAGCTSLRIDGLLKAWSFGGVPSVHPHHSDLISMLLEFKLQDDCINQDILNDSVSKSEPFTKPGRAKGCDSGWIKPRSLSSLSTPKPFTPAAFPLGVSLVWCLPSLSNLQSYIWNYLKPTMLNCGFPSIHTNHHVHFPQIALSNKNWPVLPDICHLRSSGGIHMGPMEWFTICWSPCIMYIVYVCT